MLLATMSVRQDNEASISMSDCRAQLRPLPQVNMTEFRIQAQVYHLSLRGKAKITMSDFQGDLC